MNLKYKILNLKFLSLALLFVLLALLFIHPLESINQDIGRHLATGQIIWETKDVSKTNIFSFTEPDHPFINHHWLSEVIFYLFSLVGGLKGLIILKAAILAAAFFILWLSIRDRVSPVLFGAATLIAIPVFLNRADVRPEIFSYLLLAFFILAVFEAKYRRRFRYLSWLPLAELIWVNSHIYFILGPLLIFFFYLDSVISKTDQFLKRRILIVLGASLAATLINPNGIRGALAPFTILNQYGYSVLENQSIFFLKDYGLLIPTINFFIISLLAGGFIIFKALRQKGLKAIVFEIITFITLAAMAAKMIRNTGIYAIVFVPITSLLASLAISESRWPERAKNIAAGIMLGALVILIPVTVNNKRFSLAIPQGASAAVKFVKENKIEGPVFNNFDVGSFLIWKLYPEQKVFVDGRPEAYSPEFFQNIYIPMQEDPALFKKYADQYQINYVFFTHTDITPWARQFLAAISQNPDWPLVYLDDSAAIFIRARPENSALIKKFKIR